MREFVYFSRNAWTSGNFDNPMQAGRLDIACHVVIMSFFLSEAIRNNVKLHLFFEGPPDPPKHLEIWSNRESEETKLSKKDIAGLLKRMLYKGEGDERVEAFPGCFVDRESIVSWVENNEDRNIYLLDEKGKSIRDVEIGENPIFVLGDHEGIPKKKKRRIKQTAESVSLGNLTYFGSQAVTIVQHELDKREIY